jgi:hypothetical protein
MSDNVKWEEPKYRVKLYAKMARNLDAAATHLSGKIRDILDQGQPPSKPWTPPHTMWGWLKNSIGYETKDRFTRLVGSSIGNNAKNPPADAGVGYALWLEFGTLNMLPRPYLRPTAYAERNAVLRLIGTPL